MKLDFEYEVPDDPIDEPNQYSKLVRNDLREKVFEENVKLLDDIETDKVAKQASKIKEHYIQRNNLINEYKLHKDIDLSLLNFILYLQAPHVDKSVLGKKLLLDFSIAVVLGIEYTDFGVGI